MLEICGLEGAFTDIKDKIYHPAPAYACRAELLRCSPELVEGTKAEATSDHGNPFFTINKLE